MHMIGECGVPFSAWARKSRKRLTLLPGAQGSLCRPPAAAAEEEAAAAEGSGSRNSQLTIGKNPAASPSHPRK